MSNTLKKKLHTKLFNCHGLCQPPIWVHWAWWTEVSDKPLPLDQPTMNDHLVNTQLHSYHDPSATFKWWICVNKLPDSPKLSRCGLLSGFDCGGWWNYLCVSKIVMRVLLTIMAEANGIVISTLECCLPLSHLLIQCGHIYIFTAAKKQKTVHYRTFMKYIIHKINL